MVICLSGPGTSVQTTDPDLIDEYRAFDKNFRGFTVMQHADSILDLIESHGRAGTILDYGSGQGRAWNRSKFRRRLREPAVTLYDPAVRGIDRKPEGRFDGVICSDVLEHIGEEHLDAVIAELFGYATKWVWASVCCRPAKKCFPDGRNLHVTVRPFEWWWARFEQLGTVPWRLVETP